MQQVYASRNESEPPASREGATRVWAMAGGGAPYSPGSAGPPLLRQLLLAPAPSAQCLSPTGRDCETSSFLP